MDLNKIQQVLNMGIPDAVKRWTILNIISEDEDALVNMIEIIGMERTRKKELILEMNMQLSRADMGLQAPKLNDDNFIVKEIGKFYEANKEQIGHCFRNPKQSPNN